MDCLDRTNVAMSLLGRNTFVRQLQSLNALTPDEALAMETGAAACYTAVQDELVGLWTRHGDALSLQVSWHTSLVLMYECVAVRVHVRVLALGYRYGGKRRFLALFLSFSLSLPPPNPPLFLSDGVSA